MLQDEKATGADVDETGEVDYTVTFADNQRLHQLQKRLLKLRLALRCSRDLGNELRRSWLRTHRHSRDLRNIDQQVAQLRTYMTGISSCLENLNVILNRTYGISTLAS